MAGNPRAALAEALRRVDAAGGFGWPDDRSPFPGLRPFTVDQHRVFFARTDEVEQLAELLRSPAENAKAAALLVVGPSGCGKSSLVRAGLLPVMADESGWRILPPILPGADPVAALARELAAAARRIGLDWTVEHVHHRLDEGALAALADELLVADPGGPLQHLLIVVDQFEELLTQTTSTERVRFVELLRPVLTGPVHVVGTLRSEFLDQLLGDPALAGLSTTIYPLRPLPREALRLVIEGPARLAGIDVEDELVARLVEDSDNGGVAVGVAHEAFLVAWPPLAQAIAENVSALRARRSIEHAVAEWNRNGRPPGRLWGGAQLAVAVADTGAGIRAGALVTDRVDLSPIARDFLHASLRRDRYRRRRATTVLSVLLILALAAAGIAGIQQRTAQEQQWIATSRQLVAQADTIRDTDPRTALQLGIAAQRIHCAPAARQCGLPAGARLLSRLMRDRRPRYVRLRRGRGLLLRQGARALRDYPAQAHLQLRLIRSTRRRHGWSD